ncbi:MAG: right-handed parallel beta-helix repeat-containing protein [Planctomycetota bacterium]|nr:right-handed parallel beta-helix repeat-containing protein [Planctomycetota bacterium]
MTDGPARFVDANRGDDQHDGSRSRPWKTLQHAVSQLTAGDTLYLRSGTYYEHVRATVRGARLKPITIRSIPGELAVIDGGIREFFESAKSAWEPVKDGVAGEFQSTKTYPDLGGSAGSTNVLGNFGDSMVPLHGYRYLSDLRSNNEYLAKLDAGKTEAGDGAYCGPGVFLDHETGRIHIRLAHTKQSALGDDNYRGETDPRKLSLVIAGATPGSALSLDGSAFVRLQDIVVRGARAATVSIADSVNVDLDGVTMYGGASPISVRDTAGLRLWNCACRGIAAPWTFRGSLKYRAIEARLFSASGWSPTGRDNRDFELAYSEFTDCVDGVFIGNVRNVRFHHNLLDNVSDDGIFLTATTAYDGTTPGGNVHIYQNLLSRCLTTFAFGVGHGRQKMTPTGRQAGAGVFIYRNVFDLRRPVHYQQPEAGAAEVTSAGRIAGDHGGPLWEPMTIYHNTILVREPPFRSYYAVGLGSHLSGGSMRRVFNNIVLQSTGQPGHVLPPVAPFLTPAELAAFKNAGRKPVDPLGDLLDGDVDKKAKPDAQATKPQDVDAARVKKLQADLARRNQPTPPLPIDFQADGNLHWGVDSDATAKTLFGKFRASPESAISKRLYAPGWIANDVVHDPKIVAFKADWRQQIDVRLQADSPAKDGGVRLPKGWADPLLSSDSGRPDIGAVPYGTPGWSVGIGGRLTSFGPAFPDEPQTVPAPQEFLVADAEIKRAAPIATKPVVIVKGYPAFDAPLLGFALHRQGIQYEALEGTWLNPAEYSKYSTVAVVGNLVRARIEPNQYTSDDLGHIRKFLANGGTLLLLRGNHAVFRDPQGSRFLAQLTGGSTRKAEGFRILNSDHAWLKHLSPKQKATWVTPKHAEAMRVSKGELIIGNEAGLSALYRVRVGRGQLIYVGWDISASLPAGRSTSTVEQEAAYESQMGVLLNIVESLTPSGP